MKNKNFNGKTVFITVTLRTPDINWLIASIPSLISKSQLQFCGSKCGILIRQWFKLWSIDTQKRYLKRSPDWPMSELTTHIFSNGAPEPRLQNVSVWSQRVLQFRRSSLIFTGRWCTVAGWKSIQSCEVTISLWCSLFSHLQSAFC